MNQLTIIVGDGLLEPQDLARCTVDTRQVVAMLWTGDGWAPNNALQPDAARPSARVMLTHRERHQDDVGGFRTQQGLGICYVA